MNNNNLFSIMRKIFIMLLFFWETISQCSVQGCESCEQNIQQCEICDSGNFFYSSGTTCCNGGAGQYPDGKGGCSSCSQTIPGCFFCAFDTQLSETVCTACETFLSFYPSGTTCCDGGSFQFPDGEGGCSSCGIIIDGCLTCIYNQPSGLTECTQCDVENGFELSLTICCDGNNGFHPLDYYSADHQTQCLTCEEFISGCSTCSYDSETQIVSCEICDEANGYYITSPEICCDTANNEFPSQVYSYYCPSCEKVIPGCTSCTVTNGVTGCQQCADYRYQLSGTQCCDKFAGQTPDGRGGCVSSSASCTVEGCMECSQTSNVICVSCHTISGYVLNGAICCNMNEEYANGLNVCTKCSDTIEGCLKCTSDGQVSCSECDEQNGFLLSGTQCCPIYNQIYPNGEGGCAQCATIIPGCTSCQMGADGVICNACDENTMFFLSGNTCCDTVNNAFPNKQEGCVGCSIANHGCLTCSYNSAAFTTDCIECMPGFTSSGTVCCDDSFASPDGQGGCTGCPSGCLSCSSNGLSVECSTCDSQNGYFISEGTCCDTFSGNYPDGDGGCSSCPTTIPGCFFCIYSQTRGVTACTACEFNYYPSKDICCSADDLSYPDGFGGCSSCAGILTGCITCEYNRNAGATQCTACDTENGFVLAGSICCDTNKGEFAIDEGECVSCQEWIPGCSICDLNSQIIQCVSCSTGFYLASDDECCNSAEGLYPTSLQTCSYCYLIIDGCQTCVVNQGITECSACTSPSYVMSGTICCHQAAGYFPDGRGGCALGSLPCTVEGCLQCSSSSNTICIVCDTANGFALNGDICCDTNTEFANGLNVCSDCSQSFPGCLKCSSEGAEAGCLQCDMMNGFIISGPQCCNTNIQQYPDGNGNCGTCENIVPGCTSCLINNEQIQCLACDENNLFFLSGSTCCDTGNDAFPDKDGSCVSCSSVNYGCVSCSYNSATLDAECSQCNSGFTISGAVCCEDSVGVPDGNGGCTGCPQGCLSCSSGSSIECSVCDSANFFYLSETICCNAASGQFPNGQGGCSSCSEILRGCFFCAYNLTRSVTVCTACQTFMNFYPSRDICCDTNSLQYPDGFGGCSSCGEVLTGCLTCTFDQVTASTECTSCDTQNGFLISVNFCCDTKREQYPAGYDQCLYCTDITGCIACDYDEVYYQITCKTCDSENGFALSGTLCCDSKQDEFPNGLDTCQTCATYEFGCTACALDSGNTVCTACDTFNGFELSLTKCCNTANHQYPDGRGGCGECSQAWSGCLACAVNNGVTECTSCDASSGFVLSGSRCCNTNNGESPDGNGGCLASVPCTVEGCLQCSEGSSTVCVGCDTGLGYVLNGETCCGLGEYANGPNVCTPCGSALPGCLTCSSQDGLHCLACDSSNGYVLSGTQCCNTNTYHYPDGSGSCGLCSSVSPGCLACVYHPVHLETDCVICSAGFILSGTVCCDDSISVPDGEGGCIGCTPGCLSCSTYTWSPQCSSCDTESGFILSGVICCDTGSGSFPDGEGGCSACSEALPGCLLCSSSPQASQLQCSACQTASNFHLSGDICCDANSLQYPDGFGGCSSCGEVLTGCLTCTFNQLTASTECTSCDTQNGFLIWENFCCDTARGQYPGGSESCLSCEDLAGCIACAFEENSLSIACTTCDNENGFALSGTVCCDSKQDQFPDAFGSCQSCAAHEAGCASCAFNSGSTICTTCDTFNGFELSLTKCCNTVNYQYPDGSGECSECSQLWSGCLTCAVNNGVTECTSCDASSGFVLSGSRCCNTNNGESPDGNGGCLASVPCTVEGCLQCSEGSSTVCVGCDTGLGYVLNGETCCGLGEYANGPNVCTPCGSALPGCLTCSSEDGLRCSTCDSSNGYLPSGDQCCDVNADQYPNGNGRCGQCSVVNNGCLACSYNLVTSTTECSECSAGFTRSGTICCDDSISTPDGEGACIGCPTGCLTCQTNAGILQCSSCDTQSGFFQSGSICCDTGSGSFPDGKGGCSACSEVLSGCLLCSFTAQSTQTRCSTCQTSLNFYLSGSVCCDTNSLQYPNGEGGCSSCTAIQAGCLTCIFSPVSASTECTSCDTQNGFALSGTVCCDSKQDEFPDVFGSCQSCATHEAGCIACAFNSGNTVCTACDAFNGFELSLTKCCNALNDQYPDGNGECAECSQLWSGCLTCAVNNGVTECTSCDASSGFVLSGSRCCNTNNGESPDGNGGCLASVPCTVEGCLQCSEGSSTVCVGCDTGLGYVLNGETCCGLGEYANGPNVCTPCGSALPGCLTCSSEDGLRCSTCDSSNGYLPSGDQCCDVNADQYPNGNGRCGQCSVVNNGCLACSYNLVTSTTECSECSAGFTRSGTICCDDSISTPDGEGGCIGCPTGCLSCSSNAGNIQCSSCDTGRGFYQSGSKCCNITNLQYPDGFGDCDTCESIIPGCSMCSFNQINSSIECQACDSGYIRSGGQCCSLSVPEYPDGDGGCQSCSIVGCVACSFSVATGNLECQTCNEVNGFILSGTECCDANNGQYPDGIGSCGNCQTVIPGCKSCFIEAGEVKCSACNETALFFPSGSTCCDTGSNSFPDGSGGCKPCYSVNRGCLVCEYNTVTLNADCSVCAPGFHGYQTNYCCDHPGYGPDGEGGCIGCPTGCLTCQTNADTLECLACNHAQNYYLSGSSCCHMNAGMYPDNQEGCSSCGQIILGCLTCIYKTAEELTVCSSCDSSSQYYLSGETCCNGQLSYPNNDGGCSSCGALITGCLTCNFNEASQQPECIECDTQNAYELSGTQCCDTSLGLYPSTDNSCTSCFNIIPNCLTCKVVGSATTCEQCVFSHALVGGGCQFCSEAVHSNNQLCVQCSDIDENCKKCVNETTCVECLNNLPLLADGSGCLPSSCSAIDLNCALCSDSSTCTFCQPSYALVSNTCSQCEDDQYVSQDGTSCLSCDTIQNCYSCKDEYTCINCNQNYALTSLSTCQLCTSVQTISNDGTYCVDCSSIDAHCVSCSSESVCTSCSEGYIVYGLNICQLQSCQLVDPYCVTCEGGTCSSCSPGYALMGGDCVPCGYSQTVTQDGNSCVDCEHVIPNCLTCSSESHCTSCTEGLVLISPTICGQCDPGMVMAIDKSGCVACTLPNCAQCETEFVCKTCASEYIHDPFINQCVQLQTLSLTCGNHYQLSEGCDDGNTQSGDGCSSTCQVEDGYYCVSFVGFVSECKENCGNGVVDNGETCDDGNTNSFDGCSSTCQVEIKYSCSNGGCSRNCGNNNIDAGENCDDGNEQGGDGCSSDCLVESGWSCSSYPCMPICGDGRKLGGEFCDDGNAYRGDGCSPQCSIELGWQCEGSYGQKSVCRPFEDFCGNAVRDFMMGQLCDDGNKINGDGCTNECVIQSGWLCNTNVIPNKCSRCGNGKADAGESCDDGNLFNKDGCNENCQLELGFQCSQYFPAKCLKIVPCYDGSFDPLKEACDDGNTNNEDGCNIQCQIQEGWECQNKVGEASKCSLIPVCGNARLQLQNGEQCDDGNKSPHDGCDQSCLLEQHFQCRLPLGEKSVCQRHYECGNGLQEAANLEQCDDGNNQNNDGCTANCQIERNYICLILRNGRSRCTRVTTNTPQVSIPTNGNNVNSGNNDNVISDDNSSDRDVVAEPTVVNRCGDGVKTSGEECDDGGEMSGDGCSSVCRVERGYECMGDEGEQSWCRKLCGNLVRNPGEQCDDGNEISGDGCTSQCRLQAGNFCPIVGGCIRLCGNGQVDASFAEACDDSNSVNGDGCSDTCRVEAGWKCDTLSNGTSRCSSFCGNAALQPHLGEQCDDGNVQTGDGCSNCRIQPSWRCSSVISQRSVCASASVPYCGNAKYEPLIGEECDDGNEVNTDGCSNRCVQNPNFLCSNVPGRKSMCSSQDDGMCVAGGEPPSFRLSPSEIEAMSESELSFVVSMADLVSALVSRDAAGQIVVDPIQSTQARNLYYAQDLFHEWFIVNYYVQKCQGQP